MTHRKVAAIILTVLPMITAALSSGRAAAPERLPPAVFNPTNSANPWIYLSRGPLLQQLTASGVTVAGSPLPPGKLNEPVIVEVTPEGGQPIAATGRCDAATGSFRVRVEGLPPNTLCQYTLSLGSTRMGPFPFATAPAPDDPAPFRFAVIGDTQNFGVWASLSGSIARQGPRFTVHLGDHVGTGGVEGYWRKNFFDPGRLLLAQAPLVSCHGNHDEGNGVYLKMFNLSNYWHTVDYGRVRIINIAAFVPWQEGTEQYAWLKRELARPWNGWRICTLHAPPFAVAHDSGLNLTWIENVVPLLLDAGVDLLLCGHDHVYARTRPIALQPGRRGLVQIISGGGGGKRDGIRGDLPFLAKGIPTWHFLVVDVTPDALRIRALKPEGDVLDEVTLLKDAPQEDLILAPEPGRQAWREPWPIRPAGLFRDGMVLQRDCEAPVWGWGPTGALLRVTLAGQTAEARVPPDGRWRARLPPLPAGGPHTLTIEGGGDRRVVKDVLVGDVWVCAGQSNVEWPVSRAGGARNEIAAANVPQVRVFGVPPRFALTPETDTNGRWVPCTSQEVANVSALAYFFGREIHRAQRVPVGLIVAAWGSRRIEPFISREGYAADGPTGAGAELERLLAEMKLPRAEREKLAADARAAFEARAPERELGMLDRDPGTAGRWFDPASPAGDWQEIAVPGYWCTRDLARFDGSVWMRREVNLPAAAAGQPAALELGPIDDLDVTWFNGRQVGATGMKTPASFSVPRVYPVPGELLRAGSNTIVVRVADTAEGGGLWGKPEQVRLVPAAGEPIPLAGTWRYRKGLRFRPEDVAPPAPPAFFGSGTPTAIYGGMIAPVAPYAVRGFAWYQGESNAADGYEYRALLRTLIRDWRRQWGRGDLPFLWVQLPNFRASPAPPAVAADLWPELREAQALALAEPKTAMAVAIDIGESGNIHPTNKQEVARRLALGARALAYGERVAWSGPVYRAMRAEGGRVRLSFDPAGGGLVAKDSADGALRQFHVAGADRVWRPASARIENGEVIVACGDVPAPVAVRYAWLDDPAGCNLYSAGGLPAAPFRTDDWPLMSQPD